MIKTTKQRINELEIENAILKKQQPILRDQFAMAVLPTVASDYRYDPETSCKIAYDLADAMMEARDAKD